MTTRCDQGWNTGDLVFAGTVASKAGGEEPRGKGIFALTDYEVHFSATEVFRGTSRPGAEIVVYTGHGGGECGYPFVIGKRYLVYTSQFKDKLSTSICTETAPEVMVSGTIRELRMLREQGRGDDLFGNVGMGPRGAGFEDLIEIQPLSGVPVRATGRGGSRFSTTTDDRGAYRFASLPPGAYRVEEDLPAGFSRPDQRATEEFSVDILKNSAGAQCRVSAFPKPDGVIAGKVVDSKRNGVPGFITVQPSDPAEAQRALHHGGLPGDATEDGTFSLPQLPPGKYQLIFHTKPGGMIDFRQTFYWPIGQNNASSNSIDLKFGQHIENVRFELPLRVGQGRAQHER